MDDKLKLAMDHLERAAMAYERLGKLTRDDAKTRSMRTKIIADLAEARRALVDLFKKAAIGEGKRDG